jgi:hypothetical protein
LVKKKTKRRSCSENDAGHITRTISPRYMLVVWQNSEAHMT